MTFDALVVGAGPAGATIGAILARGGWRVAICDPGIPGRRAVGETMPGAAVALLRAQDMLPDEGRSGLSGTTTLWGSEEPYHEDHLRSPFGPGLRLDRELFDEALLRKATARGATLMLGRLRTVSQSGDGHVVSTGSGDTLAARWIIDATGRAAAVVRRVGGSRVRVQRLASVHAIVRCATDASRTFVEAVRDGWWYATVVGEGRLALSFQCDGPVARRLLADPAEWSARARRLRLVAPLSVSAVSAMLRLAACDSSTLVSGVRHGRGWLAIGDAASCWDPVTSHGLYAAIRGGVDGAAVVSAALGGDEQAVGRYDMERSGRYTFVRRQIRAAYARETRWPESPFWASRQMEGERDGELRGDRRYA